MRSVRPSNAEWRDIIRQSIPAAEQAAGSFCHHPGLNGGTLRLVTQVGPLSLRRAMSDAMPGVSLSRHYRALKRMAPQLAPTPRGLESGYLIAEWLEGEVVERLPPLPQLAGLLYHLHHRPLFGWRITLRPLLAFYWGQADPARRSLDWLQQWQRLARQGEPHPLRLAPLHMDIHAGNLVWQPDGLRLIDWEYAGDGDVALELAAVVVESHTRRRELVAEYARQARIDSGVLQRQVARWRPWARLLMASWYECRWQQTGDRTFIRQADEAWHRLRHKQD
ncbi:thiamine kinase [Entomohabitans teleogrylli]|uniref:thiamine kinase n=1 Tax=Entomohabitans teleogrylli TaxID=1384589 RepID=UPI00073D6C03|nr:thiamine kinase [Entomohabitans teleogrylli]